jgi:hypothetical protein
MEIKKPSIRSPTLSETLKVTRATVRSLGEDFKLPEVAATRYQGLGRIGGSEGPSRPPLRPNQSASSFKSHPPPSALPWSKCSQTYFLYSQLRAAIYSPEAYALVKFDAPFTLEFMFCQSTSSKEERRALYDAWMEGTPGEAHYLCIWDPLCLFYLWVKSRHITGFEKYSRILCKK